MKIDKDDAIRKAEIGDIGAIKEILFSALKDYNIALPDNYSTSDIDAIDGENTNEQIFVLQRGKTIGGFVVLRPIDGDGTELKRLYLAASERGQKLGAYLLNYAVDFAKKNNYKSIRLETTSRFKEAVSLYNKFGFKELKGLEKAPGHDLAFIKILYP